MNWNGNKGARVVMSLGFLLWSGLWAIGLERVYASGKGHIDESIVIEKGLISANLKGVRLIDVLVDLERKCGSRFYADESVSREKLFVRFRNLTLHTGLERLFSGMNYIIFFLDDGWSFEVKVLGKREGLAAADQTVERDPRTVPSFIRTKNKGDTSKLPPYLRARRR